MNRYMDMRDYYAVLGVPPDASREEIDRAFRRAARESHPDAVRRAGGSPEEVSRAEEEFKLISDAYSILGHPERRRKYDSLYSRHSERGRNACEVEDDFRLDFDPEEIYRELFDSDGRPRQRPKHDEGEMRFDELADLDPKTRVKEEHHIERIPPSGRPEQHWNAGYEKKYNEDIPPGNEHLKRGGQHYHWERVPGEEAIRFERHRERGSGEEWHGERHRRSRQEYDIGEDGIPHRRSGRRNYTIRGFWGLLTFVSFIIILTIITVVFFPALIVGAGICCITVVIAAAVFSLLSFFRGDIK